MSFRYAVYLAPPADSALWRFGSRVLGRDAVSGETLTGYAPRGMSVEAWRDMTAAPRVYGFHATLKAPFRLREGLVRAELEAAVEHLAAGVSAFDLGPLKVNRVSFGGGEFVALTPKREPPALRAFESQAVRELDRFRAPATAAEIARRRPERLTDRQRAYLTSWGYPYVLDEFRLHFTLSGATGSAHELAQSLADDFAALPTPDFRVDALVLFAQPPGGEFVVVRRFALA